jgi:hypothetical protein
MIIFGWRTRESTTGRGEFACPRCNSNQPYRFKAVKTWFTLYFLPVIPLKTLGEFVQCQACGDNFRPDVLDRAPLSDTPRTTLNASSELRAGKPIEQVRQSLIESGMDEAAAAYTIDRTAGERRQACRKCGLTYHWSISVCAQCGELLGAADSL